MIEQKTTLVLSNTRELNRFPSTNSCTRVRTEEKSYIRINTRELNKVPSIGDIRTCTQSNTKSCK